MFILLQTFLLVCISFKITELNKCLQIVLFCLTPSVFWVNLLCLSHIGWTMFYVLSLDTFETEVIFGITNTCMNLGAEGGSVGGTF